MVKSEKHDALKAILPGCGWWNQRFSSDPAIKEGQPVGIWRGFNQEFVKEQAWNQETGFMLLDPSIS